MQSLQQLLDFDRLHVCHPYAAIPNPAPCFRLSRLVVSSELTAITSAIYQIVDRI